MRCSVYIATSIDGYIARKDGGLDWLSIVEKQGEDYGYAAFAKSIDVLVMGRGTYETALGFGAWPYKGKRVVVLTHQPMRSRNGEEFFSGPVDVLAAKLRSDGTSRVYVDGGDVIRQFMAAGLIDDFTLSIIPIILGSGVPLFGEVPERRLALDSVQHWPSGLVQLHYEKSRR